MLYWSQIPLLRLLIPFLLGIIAAYYNDHDISFHYALALSLLLSIILILLSIFLSSYRLRWVFGVFSYGLFGLLGFVLCHQYLNKHLPTFLPQDSKNEWVGKVSAIKKQQKDKATLELELLYYKDSSMVWRTTEEQIHLYLSATKKVMVGDYVSGESYINRVEPPKNPSQFNYAEFLKKRQVYYQTFTDSVHVHHNESSLTALAASIRKCLIQKYRDAGIQGDRLAVLVAISLGDKKYLEKSLKSNYAGAGAMHILAVSGLHVGIVYLIFSSLLSFLKLRKNFVFRLIRGLVLLFVIWSFALITGFSPSVQRASCMFSFLIVGEVMNRQSVALNSIAASAFILLLINPLMIFEVGFQLSYSAVIGIIWFHPIIYSWLSPQNWVLDKVWSLMVVSLAAQLATLPFTLYYFHQFPNWFLLTNLLVIPLAFILVSGAIVVGVMLYLFETAFFLTPILDSTLGALNQIIYFLSQLPFFATEAIWIELISAFCIGFSIFFFAIFVDQIKAKWLIYSMAFVALAIGIETSNVLRQSRQKQFVVYAVPNHSVYAVVEGLHAEVIFLEDTLDKYAKEIVVDHLNSLDVKECSWVNPLIESSQYAINFHGKLALLLGENLIFLYPGFPSANFIQFLPKETEIIVRKSQASNPEVVSPKQIKVVLDASIPSWDYDYKKAMNNHYIYAVSRSGFYLKNW